MPESLSAPPSPGGPPPATIAGSVRRLLFPDPPRDFRARRAVKIGLRALHVLCAGVLVGSFLLLDAEGPRRVWGTATVASGVLLLSLDLHESAAFLLQVRGVWVVLKMAVVAALPMLGRAAAPALVGMLLLSVVLSHAPSRLRYRLLWGQGRVRAASSKG